MKSPVGKLKLYAQDGSITRLKNKVVENPTFFPTCRKYAIIGFCKELYYGRR